MSGCFGTGRGAGWAVFRLLGIVLVLQGLISVGSFSELPVKGMQDLPADRLNFWLWQALLAMVAAGSLAASLLGYLWQVELSRPIEPGSGPRPIMLCGSGNDSPSDGSRFAGSPVPSPLRCCRRPNTSAWPDRKTDARPLYTRRRVCWQCWHNHPCPSDAPAGSRPSYAFSILGRGGTFVIWILARFSDLFGLSLQGAAAVFLIAGVLRRW